MLFLIEILGIPMKIQAAFNAVFGDAVNVYAAEVNGILVMAKISKFTTQKSSDDVILLTNNPLIDDAIYFETENFQAAFRAYQTLTQSQKCVMQDNLARFRPENVIDFDGQKENGDAKYNIAKLTNEHWAVLAICWYGYHHAKNTQQFNKTIDFMNDLENFYLTI